MMPQSVAEWSGVIMNGIALAGMLWLWITTDSKKALKRIDELIVKIDEDADRREEQRQTHATVISDRFKSVEERLLTLESEIRHLPNRDQTHRLELAVERLSGRIETLDERLRPIQAASARIQHAMFKETEK